MSFSNNHPFLAMRDKDHPLFVITFHSKSLMEYKIRDLQIALFFTCISSYFYKKYHHLTENRDINISNSKVIYL